MPKAQGSLVEGPTLDTSKPVMTLKNAALYAVGVGFMVSLLSVGTKVVAPVFSSVLSAVGIDNGEGNGVTMNFGA